MTLLVNFVSMSVHLRSAKEGPSIMRRTCICRGNEQQSLLLPRVSCPCSSHAEDEYAASRAAKAGFCLVPALVSLSVQIFPTESFIAPIANAVTPCLLVSCTPELLCANLYNGIRSMLHPRCLCIY